MKMMVKFHRNDEEEDSASAKSWASQVTPVLELEVRCLSSSVRTYPF